MGTGTEVGEGLGVGEGPVMLSEYSELSPDLLPLGVYLISLNK